MHGEFRRRCGSGIGILLLLGGAQATGAFAQSKTAAVTQPPGAGVLNDLLEAIRTEQDLPALAGGLVRGKELAAWGVVGVRSYGDETAARLTDRFHLGSCGKSMTATLCAMLVERGKLRWNLTVGEAFGAIRDEIHEDFRGVTLEQLLCHRSGLPDDRQPTPLLMRLRGLQGEMPSRRVEMVKLVLADAPATKPGTTFAYSNYGYAIAGAMAEAATGKSWEELLRTELFEPLVMKSAGFGPPSDEDSPAPGQPWGHRAGGEKLFPVPPSPFADNPQVIGPAGVIHMSIEDWMKYVRFHLTGTGAERDLLSKASLEKLHSDPFGGEYGFGWGIVSKDGSETVLRHAGSNGLWFATVEISLDGGWGIVVATNCANEKAIAATKKVRDAIVARYGLE